MYMSSDRTIEGRGYTAMKGRCEWLEGFRRVQQRFSQIEQNQITREVQPLILPDVSIWHLWLYN